MRPLPPRATRVQGTVFPLPRPPLRVCLLALRGRRASLRATFLPLLPPASRPAPDLMRLHSYHQLLHPLLPLPLLHLIPPAAMPALLLLLLLLQPAAMPALVTRSLATSPSTTATRTSSP